MDEGGGGRRDRRREDGVSVHAQTWDFGSRLRWYLSCLPHCYLAFITFHTTLRSWSWSTASSPASPQELLSCAPPRGSDISRTSPPISKLSHSGLPRSPFPLYPFSDPPRMTQDSKPQREKERKKMNHS